SIFFSRLTPSFIASATASADSSYFFLADLKNGQRNGSERTLQFTSPSGDFTSISVFRSAGEAERIARPIAIPIPSALRIAGTGFSRTKYSVRSRARPAFSLVPSHVWLIAVENFLVARRNCSRPVEPISSSRGWSCVGSGSSLVRSFSFGLIIQKEIVCRGAIASLNSVAVSLCETRRSRSMLRADCASHREAATGSGDTSCKHLHPKERRSPSRSDPSSREIRGWY